MKCKICNTERTVRIVDYHAHCIELGEYVVPGTEVETCECGACVYLAPRQTKYVEDMRNQLIASLIGKLPIGEFVACPKEHKKNTRFLVTNKIDKDLLVYKLSLLLYNAEGDGRMNIIAELAKHAVINRAKASRHLREKLVRA